MATSEARILANRRNATLSKGPVSELGKIRSRANSLKHGMTGAGIVLAERDAAVVEARVKSFQAELAPASDMGQFLVRQMAVLSVRMDHSAERESAAISEKVRHAVDDFDQGRLDEAQRLMEILGESPRIHLRKLLNSPEGIESLVDAWQDLKADLIREHRPLWTASHRERAENLTGHRIDNAGGSRIAALSRAISGDFYLLGDDEGGNLAEEARQAWARKQMVELIDAEIAELEAHYETLDFETIELDRREAPKRALFDPSKEASLARRYETEARSGFFKAMKELKRVEKEAAENRIRAAKSEIKPLYSPPLGSSWDGPLTPWEPRPAEPRPTVPSTVEGVETAQIEPDHLDRPPVGPV